MTTKIDTPYYIGSNTNNMDNQNNQQLHLSPDFKIGDRITFRGHKGIVVPSLFPDSPYPVNVKLDGLDFSYYFTIDGRFTEGRDIELFRLEEGDESEQVSDTNDYTDSIVAPSLQTFTDIAEWIAKTAQYLNGSWVVGNKSLNTEELHLMYVIQGTDNTTKP